MHTNDTRAQYMDGLPILQCMSVIATSTRCVSAAGLNQCRAWKGF
jgi:hypothetical protein